MSGISARKRIWGWYAFDWASQPYHTLLVTFVFGPYVASVASQMYLGQGLSEQAADAQAQSMWTLTQTIAGLIIGFGAPFLGALADSSGRRIPWIAGFSLLYVLGAGMLWFTLPDGSNLSLMLMFYALGFIGAEYALIFINSQLPSLGTEEEVGGISGTGFAIGYAGGIISLFILLLLFVEQGNGKTLIGLDPALGLNAEAREGTRAVGPIVALWFALFMVPYFMWVRDDPSKVGRHSMSEALRILGKALRGLKTRLSLSAYLASSMFYRDALNGLYAIGGVYAGLVLNWDIVKIGIFGIIAAFGSAVFSWIGGQIDRRTGPKPVIVVAIWVLIFVCTIIIGMDRNQIWGVSFADGSSLPDTIFFGCGVLIGGMGGILQASSRSLMVRYTDPANPTESFGLYGLSGRATAFIAPALITVVTAATGSARLGVSPLVGLFLLGLFLLRWVHPAGDQKP